MDGGIFEWNTVNDTLVHFFANVTGYLTASLGDDWILASDASSNLVTLLLPQGDNLLPLLLLVCIATVVYNTTSQVSFSFSIQIFIHIKAVLLLLCLMH